MKHEIERIMELQPLWSHKKTKEMDERGKLVRHAGPNWFRTFADEISAAADIGADDLLLEGRDGTGPKTEVPWFRFSSRTKSPSATVGWYCVYLFDTDGEAAYLCLSHGSTDWENGNFVARPHDELRALAQWVRTLLPDFIEKRPDLITDIQLNSRRSDLGPAYEASTALAIKYDRGFVPDEVVLKTDLLFFAEMLAAVYKGELATPAPVGVAPEIQEVDIAVSKAAGKRAGIGQGFKMNLEQRKAIEMHAMKLAKEELELRGYGSITNTSSNKPYDYLCLFENDEIFVEVKGTTSNGEAIILTRGEVELHKSKFPNNALVLVSGILLEGEDKSKAVGGSIEFISPWLISEEKLIVIGFTYSLKD
jgi:hypothetical protein